MISPDFDRHVEELCQEVMIEQDVAEAVLGSAWLAGLLAPDRLSIPLDDTTVLLLSMLREHQAAELPQADPDDDQYRQAEANMKHYEWERMHQANWLMCAARLVQLGLGAMDHHDG